MCHELASQYGGLPHSPMHRKYDASPVVRGNPPELGVNAGVHVCTGLVQRPQLTYRWTASGDSAREASRAYFAQLARGPRFAFTVGLVWITLSLYWNVLFALLMSVLYVQTVRRMRLRLAEGTVLESGFEDGVVRLCGPLSDSTLTSEGIQWIRTSGAWVLIRQRGVPLIGLWPAALFPRQELERVTSAGGQVP
jgi:hypothetical protein